MPTGNLTLPTMEIFDSKINVEVQKNVTTPIKQVNVKVKQEVKLALDKHNINFKKLDEEE
jgi:hypothetical protein